MESSTNRTILELKPSIVEATHEGILTTNRTILELKQNIKEHSAF